MASRFWEKKDFPDWSEEEVDKILTDSPWAKSMTVSFDLNPPSVRKPTTWQELGIPGDGRNTQSGDMTNKGGSPVGGIGVPRAAVRTEAYLTVRWSSAMPVKLAATLDKYGSKAATLPEARQEIERKDAFYVVEVFGLPSIIAYMGAQSLAYEIQQTAVLRTRRNRVIPVDSVYVPVHGAYLSITARFPRTPPITLKDKEVEFFASGGPFKFKKKFKLKPMVYKGRLEL